MKGRIVMVDIIIEVLCPRDKKYVGVRQCINCPSLEAVKCDIIGCGFKVKCDNHG